MQKSFVPIVTTPLSQHCVYKFRCHNIKGEKISCDFEEDYILKIVTVKDKSNLWIIIILCVILIIIWSLF